MDRRKPRPPSPRTNSQGPGLLRRPPEDPKRGRTSFSRAGPGGRRRSPGPAGPVRRPASAPGQAGRGSGDSGPTGPRPSGRRVATAARPARPRRPHPAGRGPAGARPAATRLTQRRRRPTGGQRPTGRAAPPGGCRRRGCRPPQHGRWAAVRSFQLPPREVHEVRARVGAIAIWATGPWPRGMGVNGRSVLKSAQETRTLPASPPDVRVVGRTVAIVMIADDPIGGLPATGLASSEPGR
jgi:hypothetical protein